MKPLLTIIERHLRDRHQSPAGFGRAAVRDPRLVFDLRRGREPRPDLARRVLAYIADSSSNGVRS